MGYYTALPLKRALEDSDLEVRAQHQRHKERRFDLKIPCSLFLFAVAVEQPHRQP
jgi:hypothetical protein